MLKFRIVLKVFVFTLNVLMGQQGSCGDLAGARARSLGGAAVTLGDFWALVNNQAGLAGLNGLTLGAAFENSFLVGEMGAELLGVVIPFRKSTFGFSWHHSGYEAFRKIKIGGAFARSFGERLHAGLQLDYLATFIGGGYGHGRGITFEAGMQVQVSDHLVMGMHTFNPLVIKYNRIENERAVSRYTLGIRYEFSSQLFLCLETEKDLDYKPGVRAGLEYKPAKTAVVRIGYATLPAASGTSRFSIASCMTFGFGLEFNGLQLDLGTSIHSSLGWSPILSLCYDFARDE